MQRRIGLVMALSLATGACSTLGMGSSASQDGPPLVNGYYIEPGDRCGESCPTFGKWKATGAADVYADAAPDADVIAHVTAGDTVTTAPGQTVVRPLRGVVQKPGGGLNAGDIVYQLLDDGEGFSFDVWRNGDVLNVQAEGDSAPGITWDDRHEEGPLSLWWVRVELANGTKGWLRNPTDFDGMGPLS
jgi:hypothetical protein